jgi:hypothetical protein
MEAVADLDFGRMEEAPFPHFVADDWLEPELYRALVDSFPECPPASGPTGFTMFWGDPDYDALIARNAAWRELFETFHSQRFIDRIVATLTPVVGDELRFDLSNARYVPYLESREDKQRLWLRKVEHDPDELWVRLDIMQGREGYTRGAHLDHRRRFASLLIYMSDGDENGMSGGDLVLHGPAGDVIVRPRHNRMVLFPCHRDSLHSVTPIISQTAPRSFVQVTVSSSMELWKPGPPIWQRVAQMAGL